MVTYLNQAERESIIETILDSVLLQYEYLKKIDNELEEIKKERDDTLFTINQHR